MGILGAAWEPCWASWGQLGSHAGHLGADLRAHAGHLGPPWEPCCACWGTREPLWTSWECVMYKDVPWHAMTYHVMPRFAMTCDAMTYHEMP